MSIRKQYFAIFVPSFVRSLIHAKMSNSRDIKIVGRRSRENSLEICKIEFSSTTARRDANISARTQSSNYPKIIPVCRIFYTFSPFLSLSLSLSLSLFLSLSYSCWLRFMGVSRDHNARCITEAFSVSPNCPVRQRSRVIMIATAF